MNEAYYSLGIESNWIVACTMIPAAVIQVFQRRAKGLSPLLPWATLGLCLYFVACTLFSFPIQWVYLGTVIAGVPYILFSRTLKWKKSVRVGVLVALIPIAWIQMWSARLVKEDLILKDAEVVYNRLDDILSAPRNGMKVTYMRREPLLGWGQSNHWFTESSGKVGLSISPNEMFWGPKGLTHGDTVGKRLAEWAHTQPVDETERLGGTRH